MADRRRRPLTRRVLVLAAHHEAGHAVVALALGHEVGLVAVGRRATALASAAPAWRFPERWGPADLGGFCLSKPPPGRPALETAHERGAVLAAGVAATVLLRTRLGRAWTPSRLDSAFVGCIADIRAGDECAKALGLADAEPFSKRRRDPPRAVAGRPGPGRGAARAGDAPGGRRRGGHRGRRRPGRAHAVRSGPIRRDAPRSPHRAAFPCPPGPA